MESWNIRIGLVSAVVVMLLGGCASRPPVAAAPYVSSPQIVDGMRSGGVRTPYGASVELKKRTKAKVASGTALKVVGSLFGGGPVDVKTGPRNEMPMGGYVDLSASQAVFEPAEMLKFADPATATAEGLSRQLTRSGISVSDDGRYVITSTVPVWGLDYDKMGEQDNYRLYYRVETTVGDGQSVVRGSMCRGVSQDKRSLEAWLADDEAEVRKAAARIGGLCADKLLADLGLHSSAESVSQAGQ